MRLRRLLVKFHLIAGLTAGAVVAVVGLTGCLLAFRGEIDRALNPHLFRPTVAEAGLARPAAVLTAAQATHPERAVVRLGYPKAPGEAFSVVLKPGSEVFVAPESTRILGERDTETAFVTQILRLHEGLAAGETGEALVRWSTLVLLSLLLTGFAIRLRRQGLPWRHLGRPGGLTRSLREAHQLWGLALGLFVAVSAVTGAAFAFKAPARAVLGTEALPSVEARSAAGAPRADLDRLVATAQARFPQATLTYVRFPAKPQDALRIDLKQASEPHANGRSFVYLDPATAEVLHVIDPLKQPWGWQALYSYNFPLHTGTLGGWPHRLLMPVIGLTPPLMFLSGLWLWLSRRRRPTRPVAVRTVPEAAPEAVSAGR